MEAIARLPNFIRRFGPVEGPRLWLRAGAEGTDPASAARPVRVPGMDRPVWLRPTRSDHSIFWQTLVQRQYDLSRHPQTVELLARARRKLAAGKVPVIVDGGGNIGLALRAFAQDYPFAHIVLVEPDADNLRLAAANAAEIATPHTLVAAGLASRSGHCRVVARERGSAGLMTEFCAASAEGAIPTVTVAEAIGRAAGGAPWIVKLDIEGAQDELFSGNTGWIEDADLIILELDDWAFPWGGTAVNFFRALAPLRFDYVIDGELLLAFRHEGPPSG